ncbi:MAG: hypothetical protein ACLRHD_00400 [Thomasclavelia spiroformis]
MKKKRSDNILYNNKNNVEINNVAFPLTDVQYAYKIGREKGQELGILGAMLI